MTFDDRSLYVKGDGIGFLLIHGLGGTPIELRYVAQGLARAGHTVYCPTLAGHCASELELKWSRWEDWYATIEEAHDRLKRECDIVIAGGLSMGAVMALHLAAQRPNGVQGLALYAPTLWYDGWSIPWYSFLFGLLTTSRIRHFYTFMEAYPYGLKDERIRNFVLKHMESGDSSQAGVLGTPAKALQQFTLLVKEVKRELKTVKCPTLIVHPREDDISGLKNAVYLTQRLGGLVDALILDDSYHMVTLDRQRHLVVERTGTFAQWVKARNETRVHEPTAIRGRPVVETGGP